MRLSVGLSQAAGITAAMLGEALEDFEENYGVDFKILENQYWWVKTLRNDERKK